MRHFFFFRLYMMTAPFPFDPHCDFRFKLLNFVIPFPPTNFSRSVPGFSLVSPPSFVALSSSNLHRYPTVQANSIPFSTTPTPFGMEWSPPPSPLHDFCDKHRRSWKGSRLFSPSTEVLFDFEDSPLIYPVLI